jgi:toxin CptA
MPGPKFSLQRSRYLTSFLLLLHVASLFLIAVLVLPLWLKLLLVSLILLNAWHSIGLHGLRLASDAVNVVWLNELGWQLQTRRGKILTGQLLGSSFITPGLTVLNFCCTKRKLSLVILPDAIEAAAFRHLRVYLTTLKPTLR